jgi:AcrR family transcriptional regulator
MNSRTMVRLLRFADEAFIDAATALVAEGGPGAATCAAIARRVGAPIGSLYHRFDSRAAILALAWSRIHGGFVERLAPLLEGGEARAAALAIAAWAREDLGRARFLLLNEAGALFEDGPPPALMQEIAAQEAALDRAFLAGAALTGDVDDAGHVAWLRFAVFDGPIALLRPHLLAGAVPPDWVDALIRALHRAPEGLSR